MMMMSIHSAFPEALPPLSLSPQQQQSLRIGVVVAQFNYEITSLLLEGVQQQLATLGLNLAHVQTHWVPGAVELPQAAQWLAPHVDAVIALGCVIKGDTDHYQYVCGMAADGLQRVSLQQNRAVVFGVLTTNTEAQALERAHPQRMNKGGEAALTAVHMALLQHRLASPAQSV